MATLEAVKFTVTQAGERAIVENTSLPAATAVGVYACRFRNYCLGSPDRPCGITLEMKEHPDPDPPPPHPLAFVVEGLHIVTDITVSCSNGRCSEPAYPQRLADLIRRVAGMLPPLDQPTAHF